MKYSCYTSFVLLMLIAVLIAVPAASQQDTLRLSERVSTSEAVLTRADFKRLACENVGDALKNITGVYVRNGQIALRDVAADKVVILLDNQRLNTAQGGGVDVITLPIDIVEKIEVIRGGSSALYGADAVGGVIKITTRGQSAEQGSRVNANAHVTIASFHTFVTGVDFAHQVDHLNYLLSYKRTTSRGDYDYVTPSTGVKGPWLNNDQSIHDLFLKGSYALPNEATLSLSGSLYSAATGAPGIIDQLTPFARLGYDNKNINASYEQANVFGNFNLKLQTYLLFFELTYKNPVGIAPSDSKHDNDAVSFEIQQNGAIGNVVELSYGYTFRHDKLTSTDIGKRERNNHAAYSLATVSFKNIPFFFDEVSLTPAVRYDYPSDFNAEWSPKISVVVKHTGTFALTLKSHLTRSYRAPTFNDLYWPKDSYSEGNPNLVPEIGVNYDAGISISYPLLGEVTLSGNYFVNNLDNLILWAPGGDGLWRPSNISKTEALGVETAFRWKPFGDVVELGADYTYMQALDKSDSKATRDKDLIYRPRNKFDVTLGLRVSGIEFNVADHFVGKRYTTAANTQWLDAYNVVDGNIGYSFKAWDFNWSLKLEMNNLGDLNYTQVEGSPVPGRELRFTLGCGF